MTFKFFVQTKRVDSIFVELPGKSRIIEQDDEWTTVEITINNDIDALSLFHAGCRAGMNEVLNQIKL
jgi:hypothetical protein